MFTNNSIHILEGGTYSWLRAFPDAKENYLLISDSLSYGQLLFTNDLQQWESVRHNSLMKIFGYNGINDKDILNNVQCLKDANQIIIWAGSNMQEQIAIPYLIHLFSIFNIEHIPVKLIQFSRSPLSGGSLGVLSLKKLQNFPEPKTLTDKDFALYKRAWKAICSDSPYELIEFANNEENISYPYLQQAFSSILRRYPQVKTGLLYWDYILLLYINKFGPLVTLIIGYILIPEELHVDNNDFINPDYLWWRIRILASFPDPLISLTNIDFDNILHMKGVNAKLTNLGKHIIEGKSSALPTRPIDEWIGGVHLSSSNDTLWFYDENENTLFPL